MDFSKPLSTDDLQELEKMFRGLATFNSSDGGWLPASSIPELVKTMGYSRTEEQVLAYQEHFQTYHGGVLTLKEFLEVAATLHKTRLFAKEYASKFDTNGSGFISAEEYAMLMTVLVKHDPRLPKKSFEEFLAEADTNQDGKVSLEECSQWIEENLDGSSLGSAGDLGTLDDLE